MTLESRERIQRSAVASAVSVVGVAGVVGVLGVVVAPLSKANLVAFQSLLQKFREPAAQSSLTAISLPGFVPLASVNLVASAPKRSIQSSGSTVLPRDLDIFLPYWSLTRPCSTTVRNGTASCGGRSRIAYKPNIIIRATQKNRMS